MVSSLLVCWKVYHNGMMPLSLSLFSLPLPFFPRRKIIIYDVLSNNDNSKIMTGITKCATAKYIIHSSLSLSLFISARCTLYSGWRLSNNHSLASKFRPVWIVPLDFPSSENCFLYMKCIHLLRRKEGKKSPGYFFLSLLLFRWIYCGNWHVIRTGGIL